MIVGADGRSSAVRKWGDFTVQSDEQRRFFAGVLMEDHPAPDDAMTSYFLSDLGLMSWIFPQGDGRVRDLSGLCRRFRSWASVRAARHAALHHRAGPHGRAGRVSLGRHA